ncbi:multisubunit sodium/proton antiporter, MrpD subunit [Halomicrobium zhouii]|uniref:Multisubunit sodium/proton antiporter, MrpD subunit n=1 Tax=Halomicrobium zhouii TaxID=767519 RepID=A0A1I6LHS1_9EURY|nr:Na(+)/H(+) antiporter subunit D [Halomicrobium zhouii]SFS02999.1 multisubunit sodium/proton antiporter, MrpD subunit [Halomicrobium zhouii]
MSALTAIPPAVVLLAVAVAVAVLPRRIGHALGILATAATAAWAVVVPAGTYLTDLQFLGFQTALLHVDAFSRLMALIFGLIGAVAVLYSYASQADSRQTAFALSYVATSIGAVTAGDWLTLLFFWELMAVTSTLLVWHYGGQAVRAGFRYAVFHGIGGSLLMGAIVWHYTITDTFVFDGTGIATASGALAGLPPAMAAVGIGVNVGFVGLHAWLPDTYPRPHIAASVFLCVFTTKTGVYGMYRAFPDGNVWIAYMGGAMAVFGVFYALLQNDMRRLLSYHIQSQVGYMIAGVGIGTALAQAGAFAHVFNHILYKSLLFMTAGVVIYRTGEEDLKKLGGLAREMPITATTFTVAALSIAGFPFFNGFVSKGIVISASHYTFDYAFMFANQTGLEWMLLIGGVGTFASFIKFGYYAFFHGDHDGEVRDANRGQSVAMIVVAVLCVVYGVFDSALFAILPFDVTDGAVVGHVYKTYTVDHVVEGVALAVAGLVVFVATKKPLAKLGRVRDVDSAYNPLTFYATRGLVRGVTEIYAAVDRLAVRVAHGVTYAVTSPTEVTDELRRRTVGGGVDTEDRPAHPLRASIGTSILVLALFATLGIVILSL